MKTIAYLFTLLALIPCIPVNAQPQAAQDDSVPYYLIVTGGELLRGVYADGHTLFMTRTLQPLGFRCVGVQVTGDSHRELLSALRYASQSVSLVIMTGGLGPTDDDSTREALSEFTGIPLHEHPEVVDHMVRRFGVQSRDQLRDNLLRQTRAPKTGGYLPNPNGSAVGLIYDASPQTFVALPGPPSELQPMVKNHLIPYLAKRYGTHTIGASLTLRFVNIGESNIDQVMKQHLTVPDDLMISSLFDYGRVDLTLSLPEDTPQARQRLKQFEAQLLEHIGEYFYTDENRTLEECIIAMLAERQASLVTAEVGSGGAVAASLHEAEEAHAVYTGGYVAPDAETLLEMLASLNPVPKRSPSLAEEDWQALAEAIAQARCSEWALLVSPIIERGNERQVWIALASPTQTSIQAIRVRGGGQRAQTHLVNRCLDILRRRLQGIGG